MAIVGVKISELDSTSKEAYKVLLNLNTRVKGGKLITFGDSLSLSTGYATMLAAKLDMTLTVLAESGSTPVSNLSDTQLVQLPSDAKVVIMGGGTNGNFVDSEDITSRTRTTTQGAINYALDYIETNAPAAIIVLITPPYRDNPLAKTVSYGQMWKDMAVYRNLILADCEGQINWNERTRTTLLGVDNIHPTLEGYKRMVGIINDAVQKAIY